MKTVTRIDFANGLRERFGLTTADAYKMVDLIFDEIEQSLINGEEVKFAGFGSFKILQKAERAGRNPKTGEPAEIRRSCGNICTSRCNLSSMYGI